MSLFKYLNSLRFKHKLDAKVHWQARLCVFGLYIFHQVKPTIEQYPVVSKFGFGWSKASATRQTDTQRDKENFYGDFYYKEKILSH